VYCTFLHPCGDKTYFWAVFQEYEFENECIGHGVRRAQLLEVLNAPFYFKNVQHRVLRAYAKKQYCDEN
jgi:hypothetical protein